MSAQAKQTVPPVPDEVTEKPILTSRYRPNIPGATGKGGYRLCIIGQKSHDELDEVDFADDEAGKKAANARLALFTAKWESRNANAS